jgi:hypothetical protein
MIYWAQSSDNDYSWLLSRDYYYQALLTGSEEQYAKTFRSIGQVMHLVSDAAVPAHVRNDAHLKKGFYDDSDPYENWVKKKALKKIAMEYDVLPSTERFLIWLLQTYMLQARFRHSGTMMNTTWVDPIHREIRIRQSVWPNTPAPISGPKTPSLGNLIQATILILYWKIPIMMKMCGLIQNKSMRKMA